MNIVCVCVCIVLHQWYTWYTLEHELTPLNPGSELSCPSHADPKITGWLIGIPTMAFYIIPKYWVVCMYVYIYIYTYIYVYKCGPLLLHIIINQSASQGFGHCSSRTLAASPRKIPHRRRLRLAASWWCSTPSGSFCNSDLPITSGPPEQKLLLVYAV